MVSNYLIPIPEALTEAARVVDFIEERESGRWRTKLFEVSEEEFTASVIGHQTSGDGKERIDLRIAREVPPGQYVTLQRRCTPEEEAAIIKENGFQDFPTELMEQVFPPESRWVPVMSDTPSEIQEHAHAMLNATGAVLITGLGLGCLAHALLAKPGITSIDIVEIDPDVLELTAGYFNDPRVKIHRGDASKPWELFDRDLTHWDYAWHDIWSQISDDNLDDDAVAEHHISYRRMFEIYEDNVDMQYAWALDEARHMRDVYEREVIRERKFRDDLRALPLDEQIDVMYEKVLRDRLRVWPDEQDLPVEAMRMFDPHDTLKPHLRKKLSEPDFWDKLEREHPPGAAVKKPSRPNAHLEG